MTATIIDGRQVADKMQAEITEQAAAFEEKQGYPPGLGVILVGEDPASQMYVRMKRRACKRAGIHSIAIDLPATATQDEVLQAVKSLNDDPHIHGILVQLPMPDHIDEETVLSAVSLDKDVDGFHPINIGALAMKGRTPTFTPATPTGCMVLIDEVGVDPSGKQAVVLGRSNIVGLPAALMLIKANATVTVCHSRTPDIAAEVRKADIVIAAIGRANYVKGDWIKPGAVIIDVGTNKIDDPDSENGYKWVGDVDFEAAKDIAGAITIVPGGVGPMTITMLLSNTMKAAQRLAQK
ncbi:MAG: bifunctional 5,10-methylenetetrahydrofolate dehydrogenase/5,10-methenyltetrahydrofolate cyclohydrolase [Anaerolineae bacterium]|nr:bifunctional 5,10-methylenetetrahydrofolate dehydrogenase/5,10-methenyltetrahydrofolate cyclohydrolase [Anaerolineae bacterium]